MCVCVCVCVFVCVCALFYEKGVLKCFGLDKEGSNLEERVNDILVKF